jgi:molybdopterin-guanine dinucleotide biosynthesis protein A
MSTHEPVTALIVAGGKSTRFGSDKASAVVAGRPLLEWVVRGVSPACAAIVVVGARGQAIAGFETEHRLTFVEDEYPDQGPLAGLVSGLPAVSTPLVFAVSCDVPLVQPGLIAGLATIAKGFDVLVPEVGGFLQPLHAVYRVAACLPVFRAAVQAGRLKITSGYSGLRVRTVGELEVRTLDPDLASFRNVNRADDLPGIEELLLAR